MYLVTVDAMINCPQHDSGFFSPFFFSLFLLRGLMYGYPIIPTVTKFHCKFDPRKRDSGIAGLRLQPLLACGGEANSTNLAKQAVAIFVYNID